MRVEDGGATFSLVIYDQPLTLYEIDTLQSIEGVAKVLPGSNAFIVVFTVDSFLDITATAVVNAQRAIKKALARETDLDAFVKNNAFQDY